MNNPYEDGLLSNNPKAVKPRLDLSEESVSKIIADVASLNTRLTFATDILQLLASQYPGDVGRIATEALENLENLKRMRL